jgi:inosine/xanthosine triphosphate pyrophosphatase family protein
VKPNGRVKILTGVYAGRYGRVVLVEDSGLCLVNIEGPGAPITGRWYAREFLEEA